MVPSDYYWTLFEPNDKRLDAWHKRYWVYDTTPLPSTGVKKGDTVTVANMGTPIVTYPAASLIMPTTKKYLEDGALGRALGDAQGYRNIIQWRKSEAYIIAAEAYMRMNNVPTGLTYINVLRRSAGVRRLTADLTQDINIR